MALPQRYWTGFFDGTYEPPEPEPPPSTPWWDLVQGAALDIESLGDGFRTMGAPSNWTGTPEQRIESAKSLRRTVYSLRRKLDKAIELGVDGVEYPTKREGCRKKVGTGDVLLVCVFDKGHAGGCSL